MKTIRIAGLLIGFGWVVAGSGAVADDALQIAGKGVGKDGVLTQRVAEVVGDTAPTTTPILAIDRPRPAGSIYQITGTVEYSDVHGEAYLEMGSTLASGDQIFTRTLEPMGPLAKISGSSAPRPFALPLQLGAGEPAPTRLVLNVVLPGPGHVTLSDLRLSGGTSIASVPGAWWSSQAAGAAGAIGGSVIGLLGATIGVLCALGRYRRFAEALLAALLGLGVGGLVAGSAALALGQPREVWFPLLLMGLLAALVPIMLRREVRRRFARAELPALRA